MGARGRRLKLKADQALLAQQLYEGGDRIVQQIADILALLRSTIYGHLDEAPSEVAHRVSRAQPARS